MNRLFARQARTRLEAEFIRDNALAIGGLLANKVGGPSAFPQQPEGYWAPLNFSEARIRSRPGRQPVPARCLYALATHIPAPESRCVRRAAARGVHCDASQFRTRALQALVLLNDLNFVEAAVALARDA